QAQITCYLHPAPHDFPPDSIPHHFCAFNNTFVMTKLVLNRLPKVSKHSPHQRGCTHMPRLSATALKKCDTLYCGRGKSRLRSEERRVGEDVIEWVMHYMQER